MCYSACACSAWASRCVPAAGFHGLAAEDRRSFLTNGQDKREVSKVTTKPIDRNY
jgi:hypothetical protein